MTDFWTLDRVVLRCFETNSFATVTDVAGKLGVSESAASSLLAMLAAEGKIRIRVVERL